jgi:hypothetical protein
MHYTSLFHHTTENGTVCPLECAALTSRKSNVQSLQTRYFTHRLDKARVHNGHQTGTQQELKVPTPTHTLLSLFTTPIPTTIKSTLFCRTTHALFTCEQNGVSAQVRSTYVLIKYLSALHSKYDT